MLLFSLHDFILFLNVTTKTSQGARQQWHVETLHKRLFANTRLSTRQITAVIRVQDKWERWTWEKWLCLSCFLLIKGLFNPFVIITYSAHHISLTYLAPGAYDYRMQIGNIPTLLIMQCADVHTLAPFLPSLHLLYFVDSCRSPHLSLTHFKENPHPSKSAILLGAYGW